MKRMRLYIILLVNSLILLLLSAINYIGIMLQFREDVNSIFLWSIFVIMMYGLVWYTGTLVIIRSYSIYQYRNIKTKYMNAAASNKQAMLLIISIIYLYGLCYCDYNFLGLIPIFLFFFKKFTQGGRFYVYEPEHLLMQDEMGREYSVKEIDVEAGKVIAEEWNTKRIVSFKYNMNQEEKAFLSCFTSKVYVTKEVA